MKTITLFLAALFCAAIVNGKNSHEKIKTGQQRSVTLESFHQYVKDKDLLKKDLANHQLFTHLQASVTPRKSQQVSPLYNHTGTTQKLDSLVVATLAEETGQLVPMILEKWWWNEAGMCTTAESYLLNQDSTGRKAYSKSDFTWDSEGNLLTRIEYGPDSTGQNWLPMTNETYAYNASGNLTLGVQMRWDPELNTWINENKLAITFNDHGDPVLIENCYHDLDLNDWVCGEKEVVGYDDQGNIISDEVFIWNQELQIWGIEASVKVSYNEKGLESRIEISMSDWLKVILDMSYDDAGNLIEELDQEWDAINLKWVNSSLIKYSYDDRNNQILQSNDRWNTETSAWEPIAQSHHEYDLHDRLVKEDYYEIDTLSGQFVGTFMTLFGYDQYDNQNYIESKSWDAGTEQWVSQFKEDFIWDELGNLLFMDWRFWDNLAGEWMIQRQDEFSYDASVPFSELLFPESEIFQRHSRLGWIQQYSSQMLTASTSEQVDSLLQPVMNYSFYYSEFTGSGVNESVEPDFRIYPNPADDYVTFDLPDKQTPATLELYTIQGQKVIQQRLPDNRQIQVSRLASGMYLYRLIQGQYTKTGNLIVK